MNAHDYASGLCWAMTEEALDQLLAIARREGDIAAAREARDARTLASARVGSRIDGASDGTTVRDGVATIRVQGPIFHHANLLTEISGATSQESLQADLRAALASESVRSILLDVDSPGGEVGGTHETARLIRAARGKKPIVAYAADMAASGAYWIASAADELYVNPTSRLGSIGVIARAPVDAKEGKGHVTVRSSASPRKNLGPETEAGRTALQEHLDALCDVFVGDVSDNRGAPINKVLTDFGRGGLLVGKSAVRAGMADGISSYEAIRRDLASGAWSERRRASRSTPRGPRSMNVFERIGRAFAGVDLQATGASIVDSTATVDGDSVPVTTTDQPPVRDKFPALPSSQAPPVAAGMTAEEKAELEHLRALRQQHVAAIGPNAAAFATASINVGKATPAERPYLEALHACLARVQLGVSSAWPIMLKDAAGIDWRIDSASHLLAGLIDARPASAFISEKLAAGKLPSGVEALSNGSEGGGESPEDRKTRLLKQSIAESMAPRKN